MRILYSIFILIGISFLHQAAKAVQTAPSQTPDTTRLQRLHILADVWGKAFLFHPHLVRSDKPLDWSAVLEEAIPVIERSTTTKEFTEALNTTIFNRLSDVSTFAVTVSKTSKTKDTCTHNTELPQLLHIAPHILYLNFSCYAYRDTAQIIPLYNLINTIEKNDTLVIDLRPSADFDTRAFDFILKTVQPLAFRFTQQASVAYQQYKGWNNFGPSVYQQQWVVTGVAAKLSYSDWSAANQFNPTQELQRRKALPNQKTVVIIVNKAVMLALRDELAEAQRNDKTFIVVDMQESNFIQQYATNFIPSQQRYSICSDTVGIVAMTDVLRYKGKVFAPDTTISNLNDHILPDIIQALLLRKIVSGTPDYTVESPYKRPDFSRSQVLSREVKLRGLFKTWTILGYFYPHLPFSKAQWDSVLKVFIPKVEHTASIPEYHLVLQELATLLGDTHSAQWIMNWQWRNNIPLVPFKLKKIQDRVIVTECATSLSSTIPLHIGDEVTAINGKSITEFETFWKRYTPASTEAAMYQTLYSTSNLENICKLTSVSTATLSIRTTQEEKLLLNIPLSQKVAWEQKPQKLSLTLQNGIGYIKLFELTQLSLYDSLINAFEHTTQGLILDLRGYPKISHFDLLTRLTSKPISSGVFETPLVSPYLRNGQGFSVRLNTITSSQTLEPHPTVHYTKPIIALIDESLISAAEDFCIYLKNINRVVFVGSQTAGTDGDIAQIQLPGEASLIFTGVKVRYPDGSPFQRIGILPNIKVLTTVKGIREQRDEILEKGIETLQIQLKKEVPQIAPISKIKPKKHP